MGAKTWMIVYSDDQSSSVVFFVVIKLYQILKRFFMPVRNIYQ